MEFRETCAVVTGGSSGIGAACARMICAAGASVVLTYFSDEGEAQRVVAQIEQAGGRALAQQADVADEAAIEALFVAAEAAFGPVRLLVNSAGRNTSGTPFARTTLDEFATVLRADLVGPFLACRRFVRGLEGRDEMHGARIVNVSSIHEFVPRAGGAGYDSAKGGLTQLTRTLALELAPLGIAVNSVAPGMILTPMNQAAIDDAATRRERESHIPMARAGTAEEVAELVLFLLSARAAYITGASVVIDGGLSLVTAQGA